MNLLFNNLDHSEQSNKSKSIHGNFNHHISNHNN